MDVEDSNDRKHPEIPWKAIAFLPSVLEVGVHAHSSPQPTSW